MHTCFYCDGEYETKKNKTWQRATSLSWISQSKILEEFMWIFPPVPTLYVRWYKQNWNKLFFEFFRNNVLCYFVGLKYPRSLSLAADDSFLNIKKEKKKKGSRSESWLCWQSVWNQHLQDNAFIQRQRRRGNIKVNAGWLHRQPCMFKTHA